MFCFAAGGGGGGRIAVYFEDTEWTGTMTSYGGRADGARTGGAGTVYTEQDLGTRTEKILTIDNMDAHTLWDRDDPDDPDDEEVSICVWLY